MRSASVGPSARKVASCLRKAISTPGAQDPARDHLSAFLLIAQHHATVDLRKQHRGVVQDIDAGIIMEILEPAAATRKSSVISGAVTGRSSCFEKL